MNKLILSGHLTEDPVLKKAKSGISYCVLNIINRDNRIPVNLSVMVFNKDAELSCQYLTKTRLIEIEAKIETDQRTSGLMYVSEKVIFGDKDVSRDTEKPTATTKSCDITDEDF
jgi:single-stranded DNA-binding protein